MSLKQIKQISEGGIYEFLKRSHVTCEFSFQTVFVIIKIPRVCMRFVKYFQIYLSLEE